MSTEAIRPVLILGAGINGVAVARELILNEVPVCLVDRYDIATGATSRSSRLIHGGLRYLEYGDVGLVRESLAERARLTRLAPQFVEPLRLFIPVAHRTGGLVRSALRFFGRNGAARTPQSRGLWLVRMGLWMYDRFAKDERYAEHRVHDVTESGVPQIDAHRYRWLCSYADAQMRFPERFVLSMLHDAREHAEQNGIEFRVLTYHEARVDEDRRVVVRPVGTAEPALSIEPAVIINATGAWGDFTLRELNIEVPTLFGGTKGSHFITYRPELREALGKQAIYAEAEDGRLIFVLPFGSAVLVGTTDQHFSDRPERAVADREELNYLIEMVRRLFPQVSIDVDDVLLHYSGVRPLPVQSTNTTGAISRDHFIAEHVVGTTPVLTLIGGKLTTCRAFGEEVADRVFAEMGIQRTADTRDRPVFGAANYPQTEADLSEAQTELARRFGLEIESIQAMWDLVGNRVESILTEVGDQGDVVPGTPFPLGFARWVIENECVQTVSDLVERRLMLLYIPDLSRSTLEALADALVDAGRVSTSERDQAIDDAIVRLRTLYGRELRDTCVETTNE